MTYNVLSGTLNPTQFKTTCIFSPRLQRRTTAIGWYRVPQKFLIGFMNI